MGHHSCCSDVIFQDVETLVSVPLPAAKVYVAIHRHGGGGHHFFVEGVKNFSHVYMGKKVIREGDVLGRHSLGEEGVVVIF